MPPKVVCIVGPTGCGKTGLGVALAERLGGEVVSCDSMQLYRGMVIGTAAPTEAETRGVPHHMVGVIDPREDYSVARYAADAAECVDGILARGKLPILVGGTAHRRKRRGFRDGPARWVPWIRALSGQCRARSGRSRVPHAGRGFLRAHGRVFGPCRLALAEMRTAAHRRHPVRPLAPPPRFLGRSRSRRMRGRPAGRQAVDA